MTPSTAVAGAVMITVLTVTIWALRKSPGEGFFAELRTMLAGPWGRQILIDFYGLEIVLALWVITHASQAGTWVALWICLGLMPVFGATAAAAYWVFAVV